MCCVQTEREREREVYRGGSRIIHLCPPDTAKGTFIDSYCVLKILVAKVIQ